MGSITPSAKLEYDRVSHKDSQVVHLLVNLEGKKSDPLNRKPLTLSAVIDVSGSMASADKIEYAKKTLKKLIANMTSDDRLGIVAYSTTVFTVLPVSKMTQEAKEKAIAEVDKLRPMESTNLSGGMLEGFQSLKDAGKQGDLVRVFLMTDGLANVGVSDIPGLVGLVEKRPDGTSLSCFGYGSDYNPELLDSMARKGGGNLHHIKNPDECMGAFGRELGGLMTCVAQAIKVKVKTKPDFKILEVLSDFDVEGNKDETEAEIAVDDVYSEERRRILLKVEIPKSDKPLPRPIKFADIEIRYHDVLANEPREEKLSVEIEQVKPEDAQKDPSKEVREEIARIGAAKAQEKAIELANAGNFAAAGQAIQDAIACCRSVGTQTADQYARYLCDEVTDSCQPDMYAAGGQHLLRASAQAYKSARGTSKGTSPMFSSKGSKSMEEAFEKGEALPKPEPKKEAPPKGLSKKRAKRE